jgi:hypothetical protein
LDRRLDGPQNRSGYGGEKKNSQPPPGIEPQNPDRPAHSPAIYRLSYVHTKFWSESLNGRDYSEDLGVDERIIVEWF